MRVISRSSGHMSSGCKSGQFLNPLVIIGDDQPQYVIMMVNDTKVVYDYQYHEVLSAFTWFTTNNYVSCKFDAASLIRLPDLRNVYPTQPGAYMHDFIMRYCMRSVPPAADKNTVDHINWNIYDQRDVNFRWANMSEQNSNRDTRGDKKPPPEVLVEAGIAALPKHVRFDQSEQKFIIESHPQLRRERDQGIRRKACISGSKAKRLTLQQKYDDIIAKLANLDAIYYVGPELDFKLLRERLNQQFETIVTLG